MTNRKIDETALASWLRTAGRELVRVQPLSGDVSPRRYARVELADGGGAIVASYAGDMEDACRRFEATTNLLQSADVRVPEILESDCARGLMLLEDAGSTSLFDLHTPLLARLPLFERAIELIRRISLLPTDQVDRLNPPLDRQLLRSELQQTVDLFLEPRGLLGDSSERQALESALDQLCKALAQREPKPCHRDFMARNLMATDTGDLIVLDHQDLRLGPPEYDLASLLNDSFFPPPEVEVQLLADTLTSDPERLGYHRAAVQRTLKAVGTFAAFAVRGSERHLPLIPPTLARTLHHLRQVPEMAPLAGLLERRWGPELGDE